jgi:hypothetical protein
MAQSSAFPAWETAANRSLVDSKLTIYRGTTCLGVWSSSEVRKLFADGLLEATDFYWREGMKEWLPLSSFLIVFSSRTSILQEA